MKTISLRDSNNRLSRNEMKTINGGNLNYLTKAPIGQTGTCSGDCDVTLDGVVKKGKCTVAQDYCYCSSGLGVCN